MVIKLNYMIISIVIFCIFLITTISVSLYNYVVATEVEADNIEKLRLPIIMYHQVKNSNLGKDIISKEEFESDLKYLKENNYTTITMTDAIGYVYENIELPENPIILTIDDGYYSSYKNVFPLLKEYDMKIVLSIIGKSTDDFSKVIDERDHAHITWNQVKEMSDSGLVEIQNHTYNLHSESKGRMGCAKKKGESLENYEKILTEDLIKLQEELTEIVGVTPNTFIYPYGKSSKETDEILKKIGFKATLACGGRINYISKDKNSLFGLKRIRRGHR